MKTLVVLNKQQDWPVNLPSVEFVRARDYLSNPLYTEMRNVRIFNLCRSYRYQSTGYYVSLLAEARGHKAIPSVTTIQDFKTQPLVRTLTDELDELIQSSLAHITSDEFVLSVYFGHNPAKRYLRLCKSLHNLFEAPLLRAVFTRSKKWQLQSIGPISFQEIPASHVAYVFRFAADYFSPHRALPRRKAPLPFALAMLVDEQDPSPPSDEPALKRFTRAAESLGIRTERIGRDDLASIGEFDALFIRTTTSVADFTYRFARKASAEGLVVVDDPLSIVRCTNKVFLAELMQRHKIPCPRTIIVHRENVESIPTTLGYPFVLKQPDSSFSRGVVKAENESELNASLKEFFPKSDLLVAQEYLPTDFDWRIGILNHKPIFACKYYAALRHWQIYNWNKGAPAADGRWETFPIDATPRRIVNCAVRAARLIGDGFYGVDLKEINGRPCLIEINDNPSIEAGVEDLVLGGELYSQIAQFFVDRIILQQRAHKA